MDGPSGSAKLRSSPRIPPGVLMAHLWVLLHCEGTDGQVLAMSQGLTLTPERSWHHPQPPLRGGS